MTSMRPVSSRGLLVMAAVAFPIMANAGLLERLQFFFVGDSQQVRCGAMPELDPLPSLDAVLDSAAFAQKLVAAAPLVRPGSVVVALHFEADGHLANTALPPHTREP